MVASTYEERRKKRLEENKRRMEELNILSLSSICVKKPIPPKPPRMKKANPRSEALNPVRRSSRVADQPQPNYKEETITSFERSLGRTYKRDLLNRKYASHKDRLDAVEKANGLELGLGSQHPTFVKPMLRSHVIQGFWTYLPSHDATVTLVDEDGVESEINYLAAKNGLSGGWRGFSLDHQLSDGDALVFQLIRPTVFKVYIIRVDAVEDDDEDKADVNGQSDHRPAKTRSGKK